MNIFLILSLLVAVALMGYGIKQWFVYRSNQGKETSNSTMKKAIGALLIGFLALAGIAPILADVLIQLLNEIPGVNLINSELNNLIGLAAFFMFCFSIIFIIYFYYRNRHRLYHDKKETISDASTENIKLIQNKNKISNSKIKVKGDFRVGDDRTK